MSLSHQLLQEDALFNWRKKAWNLFEQIGLPKPKQEAFQYLSLQKLVLPNAASRREISLKEIEPHFLPECAGRLVFIDGFFEETLSQVPSPLICLPLDAAMRPYGLFLQNKFSRSLKEEKDPFCALNCALQGRGAFLFAAPNSKINAPIQILNIATSSELSSPRLEVYVGKKSSLSFVQTSISSSFSNRVFDAILDEGAELSLCTTSSSSSIDFQAIRANLKRDSRFKLLSFAKGAAIERNSIRIQLIEENSEALLEGLTTLEGDRQSHIHATVEHLAPHTRSRQHFKTVLKGKSRSSFEGKIGVRPIAQKTEAYQLNNNLILSDEASAHAKPNLEIFADDVKASHGATISQLDEEQVFYLRSRGLPEDEARELLVNGFSAEIIEKAPIKGIFR